MNRTIAQAAIGFWAAAYGVAAGGEEFVLRILGPDGAPQAYAQMGRYIDWSYAAEPTVESMSASFAPFSDATGIMRVQAGEMLSASEGAGVHVPAILVGGDLESMALLEIDQSDFAAAESPREIRLARAAEVRGVYRVRDEDGNIVDPGGGMITASLGDHAVAGTSLMADGAFMLRLPPGTYRLDAHCWLDSGTAEPVNRELRVESGAIDLDLEFKARGVNRRNGPAPTVGWPLPALTAVGVWRDGQGFEPALGSVTAILFWSDLSVEGLERLAEINEAVRLYGLLGLRAAAVYTGETGPEVEAALASSEANRGAAKLVVPVGWDVPSGMPAAFRLPGTPALLVTDRERTVIAIESDATRAMAALRAAVLAPPPDATPVIGLSPPSAPAPEAPASGAPAWWAAFTGQYALDPGTDAKYVYPPYTAARGDYAADTLPGAEPPSFMILADDDRAPGAWPAAVYAYGKSLPLAMLLTHGLGLRPWEIDGPEALLDRDVMGDWVFRDRSDTEAALRGVAAVLRETFALPVTVARAEAPRRTLIVEGKGGRAVDVQDAAEEAKGARLCKQLELLLGLPVENRIRISYGSPPGASLGVPGLLDPGPDIATETGMGRFLNELAAQTVLEFRFEERPAAVWRFSLDR